MRRLCFDYNASNSGVQISKDNSGLVPNNDFIPEPEEEPEDEEEREHRKKVKKRVFIAIIIVLIIVFFLGRLFVMSYYYGKGEEMFSAGNYQTAYIYYSKAGSFKDADVKRVLCYLNGYYNGINFSDNTTGNDVKEQTECEKLVKYYIDSIMETDLSKAYGMCPELTLDYYEKYADAWMSLLYDSELLFDYEVETRALTSTKCEYSCKIYGYSNKSEFVGRTYTIEGVMNITEDGSIKSNDADWFVIMMESSMHDIITEYGIWVIDHS